MISNILQETERVVHHVIIPLLLLNQHLMFILFISCFLVYKYSFFVLSIFALIFSVYFISFKYVKNIIAKNGERLVELNRERLSLLNEGFVGLKDVKLYGNEGFFIKHFDNASNDRAKSISSTSFLGIFPRFILEWLIFVTSIAILLILFYRNHDIGQAVPHMSVLALAAIKLLPSFQQVFSSMTLY